jgi:hypothetical protein
MQNAEALRTEFFLLMNTKTEATRPSVILSAEYPARHRQELVWCKNRVTPSTDKIRHLTNKAGNFGTNIR